MCMFGSIQITNTISHILLSLHMSSCVKFINFFSKACTFITSWTSGLLSLIISIVLISKKGGVFLSSSESGYAKWSVWIWLNPMQWGQDVGRERRERRNVKSSVVFSWSWAEVPLRNSYMYSYSSTLWLNVVRFCRKYFRTFLFILSYSLIAA